MKRFMWLSLAALLALGMFGITGCEQGRERYEDPPWLGGSTIETLEKLGNYTIFLELMEKANYRDPIEKQLFTLFVPDDAAFQEYFNTAGISSVEDMSEEEARVLFTLHVLRNPRSRYYLIYEYVWSEFQGPKGEYASLFHRKETQSESVPYKETVRYLPGFEGTERTIYTNKKNVPLWSTEWFGDFGGARDGSDYTFMYPGSTWEEGYPDNLDGLNWHNAAVIPNPESPDELEVRTASGFIYYLDRVVPPMESIEEYIRDNEKYSLYYDILQRFANYHSRREEEDRTVQYRKTYDLVFDLADERGPSTNTSIPPQNMWTALLPPNEILQEYLDQTIFQYYTDIDSVPRVTLYYILQSQLSASLVLKSKIANGYFNAFGDPTDLTADDIVGGYMCSNGCVYEMKRVIEPNVFKTVPGLLFFDKDYSTLLFIMNQASMLSAISNPGDDVTVFAATNEALEEYGVRFNETNSTVEFRGPVDGQWKIMRTADIQTFAQNQIITRVVDVEGQEGYAELASGNFIRYGNSTVAGAENDIKGEISNVVETVPNDQNGVLVKVDRPIESRLQMGQVLTCNPTEPDCLFADPEVSEFAQLLVDLKFLDDRYRDPITKEFIPRLKFLAANDYWTAFIPTNDAMAQARAEGIIPTEFPSSTEGQDSLKAFASYHFVVGNVVFDDGQQSGEFNTNYTYVDTVENETVNAPLFINNQPQNMTITDVGGQVIPLDHDKANILVEKGVMHKLDAVLKYTED